ncbi:CRISPR-associated Cas5t family protein [Hydrogenivirga caldilitoris]|uniref:CRISPR-associated Cas5t family protein n=1 Tax=Hydrogenivirga caldilitoris TaxID=246264 RepID=A0A497XQZ1_9AQUI|nr:type I-B CRISPR-associated protein Cas5b [Hydrogenivirga caldilitoris]RLJ70701.1 CRISPR-associated Cas5t family protein [Hydrogenivirga caldilitoris]
MECLKFEVFSPSATFKTPFSLKGIETYPLPTYSTIIGLLYTALGRKYGGEKFSISVQGDYETLFRDYIRFRKYNKKDKKFETLPLEVPRLFRLRSIVHILGEEQLLKTFKEALEKPSVFLSFGGGEYPVLVKNPRILKLEERFLESELKYSAYVPDRLRKALYGEGIVFRIPSFYRIENNERMWNWETVYYFPKGTLLEGKLLSDEEGDTVWV